MDSVGRSRADGTMSEQRKLLVFDREEPKRLLVGDTFGLSHALEDARKRDEPQEESRGSLVCTAHTVQRYQNCSGATTF